MEGLDYAWGFSFKLPAAIKSYRTPLGVRVQFVVRYIGTSSKCLTAAERDALHAAGIGIALVYEVTGTSFKGGEAAGQTDGTAASAAAKALGVPAGTPIWFAIDVDTADFASTNAYLLGCAKACPSYEARLYGSYAVVQAAGGANHWQTYAWSGLRQSLHAGLYQYHNGTLVGGVDMDNNRTLGGGLSVLGGWLTVANVPVPVPGPKPIVHPVAASKDTLRLRGNINKLAIRAVPWMNRAHSIGDASWKNLCKKDCRVAYGITVSHTASAYACWIYEGSKHQHTWYNAPFGVPVFWKGGSAGNGHVAISDGNGNVWTNDFSPNGYIGDGRIRLVPESAISQHDKALVRLGWTDTFDGISVYTAP